MFTRVPTAGIIRDVKSITTKSCSVFSETILAAGGPNCAADGPTSDLSGFGVVRPKQPAKRTATAKPTAAMRLAIGDGNNRLIMIFIASIREIGAPGVTRTRDRRIRNRTRRSLANHKFVVSISLKHQTATTYSKTPPPCHGNATDYSL